jgi:hypothetical protein
LDEFVLSAADFQPPAIDGKVVKPNNHFIAGRAPAASQPVDRQGPADRLRLARLLSDNGQYDRARTVLQDIIAQWEGTSQAVMAKQMLVRIKDK